MKRYITYLTMALALVFSSCNNEFDEEVFRHIIGLKSVLNEEGTTNVYLRYAPDGKAIYELPVIVGGSKVNERNLDIKIAVDPDTLAQMNEERYKDREDLYYQLLTEEYYRFISPTCHIPSGESVGLFDIEFNFTNLDLRYKWVLPLTVVDDPAYEANPRKNYRKAFLRVFPFNDYSGTYGATTMNLMINNSGSPFNVSERIFYVVDEHTCFFYAGAISDDYLYREKYKVNVRFNDDGTLTVTPADPANEMNFQVTGACSYTTSSRQDETEPNIVHEYTTVTMSYSYENFTDHFENNGNPFEDDLGDPVRVTYSATGTYTMERRVNTSIPDRDQAIQW